MPAERAAAWMAKAENDLLAVDNNLASARVPYDVVCFHCQQAAEKYLKALLVSLGRQPLRTHDLLALLQELRSLLATAPDAEIEQSCILLNPYSIESRYPDDGATPGIDDANEARSAAVAVRQWVRSLVLR